MTPSALVPLFAHLWQSTVFAAAIGLLTLLLRRNRASVRYWLWFAASFKFLVPFSLLVEFGRNFHWRPVVMMVAPGVVRFTDTASAPLLLAQAQPVAAEASRNPISSLPLLL